MFSSSAWRRRHVAGEEAVAEEVMAEPTPITTTPIPVGAAIRVAAIRVVVTAAAVAVTDLRPRAADRFDALGGVTDIPGPTA